MKVADLFARLGLKVDRKEFAAGEGAINKFAKGTEGKLNRLTSVLTSRLAGLAGITAAVFGTRDALRYNEALGRLGITAQGKLGTLDQLSAKILKVSDATGVSKEQILQGTSRFIELTGSAEEAAAGMDLFAKVSQAAGAPMNDVAGSAAAMSESLGIAAVDYEKAFSILIRGGKAGAAELKDTASVMARLAALSSQLEGGSGIRGLANIGSALQLATAAVGGDASEGATTLEALIDGIGQAEGKLKAIGIRVTKIVDGKEVKRNLREVVEEIDAAGLSSEEFLKIFGRKEARRAFEALTKTKGEWRELEAATMGANDVAEDYAKINQNAAVKVSKAWNKIKNAVTRAFAVVVDAMAWMSERIKPILVILGSIAVAFIALQVHALGAGAAASAAGLAAARAWIMALAPVILLGLLLAAIILIIEDIWTTLNGGEGMFDGTWLEEIFIDAIAFWHQQFKDFFDWVERKFRQVTDAINDGIATLKGEDTIGDKARKNAKRLRTQTALEALTGQVIGEFKAQQVDKKISDFDALAASMTFPATVPGKSPAGNGISNVLNVVIEAGANVDQATIKNLTDQTQEAMARTSRQLASEAQ